MTISSNNEPVPSPAAAECTLSTIRQAKAVVAVRELQSKAVAESLDNLSSSEVQAEIASVRMSRRK